MFRMTAMLKMIPISCMNQTMKNQTVQQIISLHKHIYVFLCFDLQIGILTYIVISYQNGVN